MPYPVAEVVLDCHDPEALASFYIALLDAAPRQWGREWSSIRVEPIIIGFQRVPEGKSVKNRCHLDFACEDLEEAAAHAIGLGAIRQGAVVDDPPGAFIVLVDPEGNEFCFVSGYPDDPAG